MHVGPLWEGINMKCLINNILIYVFLFASCLVSDWESSSLRGFASTSLISLFGI